MNIEQMWSRELRARRHAALADVARLQVVDALALSDRSPTELQIATGLTSNLMAHHLKVLQDAGIVSRRRSEGDRRRTYLTLADLAAVELATPHIDAARVLFVCSANSARSQLAAGIWSQVSAVPVASAGTRPADAISAGARAVAARRDLTLLDDGPQAFVDIAGDRDLIVAVCDSAYEELGDTAAVHWSIPDPVAKGDDAAFDEAYAELEHRIAGLASQLLAG